MTDRERENYVSVPQWFTGPVPKTATATTDSEREDILRPPMTERADRFWSKVNFQGPLWNGTPCWLWTGCLVGGYGQFAISGNKRVYAPRFAYETLVGPIPEGLTIDHLCRNPPCVNADHMEPVTNRVNILRGNGTSARNARKTHCSQGHPFDAENTFYSPEGSRVCRECKRVRGLSWRHRMKSQGVEGVAIGTKATW